MANTYTQIHVHVVFAVKGRASLVPPAHADELYRYITGIVSQQGQKLLAINGMPDHVHLLIGLRPDKALSDLVREIKSSATAFVNNKKWLRDKFAWQEGFGAFSYAASQLPAVVRYIQRQPEHHARRTFGEEYRLLLERFGVEYDPRYLFEAVNDEAT